MQSEEKREGEREEENGQSSSEKYVTSLSAPTYS